MLMKCILLFLLSCICLPTWIGYTLYGPGVDSPICQLKIKAKSRNTVQTVAFGDSVWNGLWETVNKDEVANMAKNQAVTACGNYLLMRVYLENNPQTQKVYYIVRAPSLANDMWASSYVYCILPLLDKENMPYVESETKTLINQRFGKIFVGNEIVRSIMRHNRTWLSLYITTITGIDDVTQMCISETSAIYLKRMYKLCQEYGADFYVLPCPLIDKEEYHDWTAFEKDIKRYGLEEMLGKYAENTLYYSKECFDEDEVHLTDTFRQANGDMICDSILAKANGIRKKY